MTRRFFSLLLSAPLLAKFMPQKRKATIVCVGTSVPDGAGGWMISDWWIEGGDYPGCESRFNEATGEMEIYRVGGYTFEELRAISQAERERIA